MLVWICHDLSKLLLAERILRPRSRVSAQESCQRPTSLRRRMRPRANRCKMHSVFGGMLTKGLNMNACVFQTRRAHPCGVSMVLAPLPRTLRCTLRPAGSRPDSAQEHGDQHERCVHHEQAQRGDTQAGRKGQRGALLGGRQSCVGGAFGTKFSCDVPSTGLRGWKG